MSLLETYAYWVAKPGVGRLQAERIAARPQPGFSLVQAQWSAVSPGTERLVGLGQVPPECSQWMACAYMAGSFELPLKYGYCLIGNGVEGALAGQSIFVMHPHQELAQVRDADAIRLPADLPLKRAALIPNLETALNAVWDAELDGEEVCSVVGAGSVGLLIAYVLWRTTGRAPRIIERDPERREFARQLPFGLRTCSPEESCDQDDEVSFHASGNPAGLQLALNQVGFEGRVIELSWYGDKPVKLELGTHFHYGRKRIVASQVGHVAASHRESHGYAGRVREVLALLDQAELDLLLGTPVPFENMPQMMDALYRGESNCALPLIEYGAPESHV